MTYTQESDGTFSRLEGSPTHSQPVDFERPASPEIQFHQDMSPEQHVRYVAQARRRGARSAESMDREIAERLETGGQDARNVATPPPLTVNYCPRPFQSEPLGNRSGSSSTPPPRSFTQPEESGRGRSTSSGRTERRVTGERRQRERRIPAAERASESMQRLYDRENRIRSELLRINFLKLQMEAHAAAQCVRTKAAEQNYWDQRARNEHAALTRAPIPPLSQPIVPQLPNDGVLSQTYEEWLSERFPEDMFERYLNLGFLYFYI